ncbi:glycosyltransferase family 4 protein [Halobacteriaceae archaeon SHR40]|uniref:glycosyltransferase family 4 protein n=1 Tax=Halovenus amylolytica TaxID=2500550 RepID=UPI000FE42EE0
MKILHVYDGHEKVHHGQGSLPRIIWNIARRTADRGHDVTVIERQWEGLPPVSEHEGVIFRRLSLGTGSDEPWEEVPYEMVSGLAGVGKLVVDRTNFALKTLHMLRNTEYDAIHVYLPFSANVLVTLSPGLREKMIYTAQLGELRLNALTTDEESDLEAPSFLEFFSPDIYLARRTAYTTVLNPTVKRIFSENGVQKEQMIHIPNGVDVQKFEAISEGDCERVRDTYDLGDRPVVFFAGTVMPRKGVAEFAEAAAEVVAAGHDSVEFLIAGETDLDEEYMNHVRTIINEAGIEANVTFTGYLNDTDLLPLYRTASVFVLPSFEEGFGMVVSEAMAAGTPPVASRISGVKQQINDKQTGILVEPGNSNALADALLDLLEDPEKRETMGERSQQRAEQFSWERITDQYIDLYKRVAESAG